MDYMNVIVSTINTPSSSQFRMSRRYHKSANEKKITIRLYLFINIIFHSKSYYGSDVTWTGDRLNRASRRPSVWRWSLATRRVTSSRRRRRPAPVTFSPTRFRRPTLPRSRHCRHPRTGPRSFELPRRLPRPPSIRYRISSCCVCDWGTGLGKAASTATGCEVAVKARSETSWTATGPQAGWVAWRVARRSTALHRRPPGVAIPVTPLSVLMAVGPPASRVATTTVAATLRQLPARVRHGPPSAVLVSCRPLRHRHRCCCCCCCHYRWRLPPHVPTALYRQRPRRDSSPRDSCCPGDVACGGDGGCVDGDRDGVAYVRFQQSPWSTDPCDPWCWSYGFWPSPPQHSRLHWLAPAVPSCMS